MPQQYEPEFKQQIVRLHLEEGRTYRSLTAEYGISKANVCKTFTHKTTTITTLLSQKHEKRASDSAFSFAAPSRPIVTISTSATCAAPSRRVGGHKNPPS